MEQVPEVALSVAVVARRLGVAPATLRTWDRRYGIGPTGHNAGCHRRYTTEDLARLETMNRLIHSGVPVADAARAACNCPPAEFERLAGGLAGDSEGIAVNGIAQSDPLTKRLARLALALDGPGCLQLLVDQLRVLGAQRTWLELAVPVLTGIGERWQTSGRGIDVEHVLSDAVTAAYHQHIATSSKPQTLRPVLFAAAPDEQHVLGMVATAAVLAENRIPVRLLGQRVPPDAVASAIHRLGPSAVFVWSQTEQSGDPAWLNELPQPRPGYKLVVAGPGWGSQLPDRAVRVDSMPSAVAALASAAHA